MRVPNWTPIALLLLTRSASAEDVRTVAIDHSRMSFADVVPNTPEDLAGIDLGPSPPPGASRLVGKDEMILAIRRAGLPFNPSTIPQSVRVVGASKRIPSKELTRLATAEIAQTLPPGVDLLKVEGVPDVVVPPRAQLRSASMSAIPHHKGETRGTAVLDITSDDITVASIPVTVVIDVSEAAARPDVPRGTRLNLIIERRSIRISATAMAIVDGNVGDSVAFQVVETGRSVRARISARDEAVVVEAQ